MKKLIVSAAILTIGILVTSKTYVPILAMNSIPTEGCASDIAAEFKSC